MKIIDDIHLIGYWSWELIEKTYVKSLVQSPGNIESAECILTDSVCCLKNFP